MLTDPRDVPLALVPLPRHELRALRRRLWWRRNRHVVAQVVLAVAGSVALWAIATW